MICWFDVNSEVSWGYCFVFQALQSLIFLHKPHWDACVICMKKSTHCSYVPPIARVFFPSESSLRCYLQWFAQVFHGGGSLITASAAARSLSQSSWRCYLDSNREASSGFFSAVFLSDSSQISVLGFSVFTALKCYLERNENASFSAKLAFIRKNAFNINCIIFY
jgi:hypothetical protein